MTIYTKLPDAMLTEVLLATDRQQLWHTFMDDVEHDLIYDISDGNMEIIKTALMCRGDSKELLKKCGIPFEFNNIDYTVLTNFIMNEGHNKYNKTGKIIRIQHHSYQYWSEFLDYIINVAYDNFRGYFSFMWLVDIDYKNHNLKTILGYATIDDRLRFLEAYNMTSNKEEFNKGYFYRSLKEGLLQRIKNHMCREHCVYELDVNGWPLWSEYDEIYMDTDLSPDMFPTGLVQLSESTEWSS